MPYPGTTCLRKQVPTYFILYLPRPGHRAAAPTQAGNDRVERLAPEARLGKRARITHIAKAHLAALERAPRIRFRLRTIDPCPRANATVSISLLEDLTIVPMLVVVALLAPTAAGRRSGH